MDKERGLKLASLAARLTSESLQKEVDSFVFNIACNDTDDIRFNEVWDEIEAYKRDNPLIEVKYPECYWGFVGKERLPFTYHRYSTVIKGGKKLNKSDRNAVLRYCGYVTTLIMSMKGTYSTDAARKAADRLL